VLVQGRLGRCRQGGRPKLGRPNRGVGSSRFKPYIGVPCDETGEKKDRISPLKNREKLALTHTQAALRPGPAQQGRSCASCRMAGLLCALRSESEWLGERRPCDGRMHPVLGHVTFMRLGCRAGIEETRRRRRRGFENSFRRGAAHAAPRGRTHSSKTREPGLMPSLLKEEGELRCTTARVTVRKRGRRQAGASREKSGSSAMSTRGDRTAAERS